jgi:hypothetical protein
VGVVDVVARPVGEDGVHQMGFHLRRHGTLTGKSTGIVARCLVLEVPSRSRQVHHVGVHQQRRGRHGVPVASDVMDPVLRFDTADLGDRHENDPSPDPTAVRGSRGSET